MILAVWDQESHQDPAGVFAVHPPGIAAGGDFSFLVIGATGEGDASQHSLECGALFGSGAGLHGTVVVAVVPVRMVQVAVHQVVHMVAVRHGFVAAGGAVSISSVRVDWLMVSLLGERSAANVSGPTTFGDIPGLNMLLTFKLSCLQTRCTAGLP